MKRVNIVMPFTFTHSNGNFQRFNVGVHELEDEIAEHWYVVAHSDNPPVKEPVLGTPEYAKAEARKTARRKLLEEAVEAAAEEEIAKIDEETQHKSRRRILESANKPPAPTVGR